MTDDQQRAAERNVQTAREVLVACNVQPQFVPTVVAAIAATLDETEARGRAEAWDAGYAAAQLDADEEPYSDRPERATWQPRQNPHRVEECGMTVNPVTARDSLR